MRPLKILANAISVVLTTLAMVSLLAVSVLPNVLGYKTYTVLSGSMAPSIRVGDMVFALPVAPETLRVDDVIVYNRSDVSESVTHRIVQITDEGGKPAFITKGDANATPDSWTVRYNGNTAGKVVLTVPFLGYAYHAVASPQGRLLFLAVPVTVLTLLWLAQLWRPRQQLARIEREVPAGIAPAPRTPLASSAAGLAATNLTSRTAPPSLPLRQ